MRALFDASGAGPPVRPRRRGARSGRPRRNRRSAGEGRDDDLLDAAGVPYAVVSHAGAGPLSDRRTARTRDRSRRRLARRIDPDGSSQVDPAAVHAARLSVRARWCSTTASTSDCRRPHAPVRGRGLVHLRDLTATCRISADTTGSTNPRTPPELVHAGSGGAATTRRR